MSALAAAVRTVVKSALVLAAVASVLWAAVGATGLQEALRLAVMSAVTGGAATAVAALQGKPDPRPQERKTS